MSIFYKIKFFILVFGVLVYFGYFFEELVRRHELKHHKLPASNAASMAFRGSSGVCFLFELCTSGFVGEEYCK
jgi:hypothetical protein